MPAAASFYSSSRAGVPLTCGQPGFHHPSSFRPYRRSLRRHAGDLDARPQGGAPHLRSAGNAAHRRCAADPGLRQGLAMALDRRAVLRRLEAGRGRGHRSRVSCSTPGRWKGQRRRGRSRRRTGFRPASFLRRWSCYGYRFEAEGKVVAISGDTMTVRRDCDRLRRRRRCAGALLLHGERRDRERAFPASGATHAGGRRHRRQDRGPRERQDARSC